MDAKKPSVSKVFFYPLYDFFGRIKIENLPEKMEELENSKPPKFSKKS